MSEALRKKYKQYIELGSAKRPKSYFSLGPLSLNIAVGDVRGVESGRIVQIVGKQSSGKTTLALDIIAWHHHMTNQFVLYIDFERSFDQDYAAACGVNLDLLLVARPDTTEQGLTIAEEAIKSGDVKLVIIDSIAAAMPSSEVGKDYEDSMRMASNAGIITRFANRIVPLLDNNDSLVIVLNQLRKNFSTLSPETEVPFGGMALQYATSVTLQTAKIDTKASFQKTQVIVKKNKTNNPQGRTEFTIEYGTGIKHNLDIIDLAIARDIVQQTGKAWYAYGDLKANGKEKAGELFPLEEIKEKIINAES